MPIEHSGGRAPGRARRISAAAVQCLFAALILLAQGASHPLFAQGAQNYIVAFREGTPPATRDAAVRNAGAAVRVNFRRLAASAVTVPNAAALAALRADPSVLDVVPDRPVSAYQRGAGKPGSGGGGSGSGEIVPAGVVRVGAPTMSSNGAGVGVAILDTGIDLAHPDLTGTVNGFTAFGASCQDDEGHGTHVAGTVAARSNGSGVIGVAPAAQLYCVKVLDANGNGSDSTIMMGLEWVLDARPSPAIKVVNMSLGRVGSVNDNPALRDLVAAVAAAGISVIVAAGNDPSLEVDDQIPAAYPDVISVASTTARTGSNQCRFLASPIAADTASYFTSDGAAVAISAPGEEQEDVSKGCMIRSVGILSTRLGGGTTRMSGTSMAAPHVAGVVARYYQAGAAATAVRTYLQGDAERKQTAPLDSPTSSYSYDGVREGIAQAP